MRTTVISILLGGLIGAGVVLLLMRQQTPTPGAANRAAGAPAAHPLVGSWQLRVDPITAIYRFSEDGSFVLTFRNAGPGSQDAGGSWRVDADTLFMLNTWSNTPLTVVGEEESARIESVTAEMLILQNIDRKGNPETLKLERVHPFVKGSFDRPQIIGVWGNSQYMLSLLENGDVTRSSGSSRVGHWSQRENRLTLMMMPPPRAAHRAADPARTEPREEQYEIVSLIDQTLVLRRVLPPSQENIVLHRTSGDFVPRRPGPQK